MVAATEGYDLLERKLVGTRFTLDRTSKASQHGVKEAREAAGFKVERPRGVSTWVRRTRRNIGD